MPLELAGFFHYGEGSPGPEPILFLANRSEADWKRIVERTERRRFVAGEELIRAGELDRSLMILVDGELEVIAPDAAGGFRRLETIQGRSVIGELAFFDGRPRSATVRALTSGHILRLTFEEFEILSARHPELGRAVLLDLGRILAERLRQTTEAMLAAGGSGR